ncbi:MAG: hypothetical protein LQ339_008221 [Xanthoria mediterranea]|nr:MAG: hypothetical protein LQ339_008221 [Xanthoria mediterranea]
MPTPTTDSDTNANIKAIYTERSSTYGASSFHPRQAKEYIHRANLKPGDSVLDLACGTGLVTILAKQHVGPAGRVIGIDISPGMLDVARKKTSELGLDIEYLEHDITDLDALPLGEFDIVTCASALLLLQEPLLAIEHWAALLVPNGRLLVDVMIERNVIAPAILTKIGPLVGRSLRWSGAWVESEDSLRQLFTDAGLTVEEVYASEVYETRDYQVEDGPDIFEKTVTNPMFRVFGEPDVREKAKELFVEEFKGRAGPHGVVREEVKFYMGIARKESKQ